MANMLIAVTLLSISIVYGDPNCEPLGNGRIILTHWLWRHGDRTPGYPFPTDEYADRKFWPNGPGQLTTRGKQQHYRLGQFLRQRYQDLLPIRYDPRDIYVRSTDYDRTINSAQSNMAGLYSPTGDQIWNDNILWQPIPVHVVDAAHDILIAAELANCEKFMRMLLDMANDPEVIEIVGRYTNLTNYVLEKSGLDKRPLIKIPILNVIYALTFVRDNFIIQGLYHKVLPDWAKDFYPTEASEEIYYLAFTLQAYTPPLARLRIGFLLKEILRHCQRKILNKLEPNYKAFVYSSHDVTVAHVLKGLGLFEKENIDYATAILIDLVQYENGHFLEFSIRKNPNNDEVTRLRFKNCENSYSVKLQYMKVLYKDIIPTASFEDECKI